MWATMSRSFSHLISLPQGQDISIAVAKALLYAKGISVFPPPQGAKLANAAASSTATQGETALLMSIAKGRRSVGKAEEINN